MQRTLENTEDEVAREEELELEQDDTIKEEDEDEDGITAMESSNLMGSVSSPLPSPMRLTTGKSRSGFFSRLKPQIPRRRPSHINTHEADLLEGAVPSARVRSRSTDRGARGSMYGPPTQRSVSNTTEEGDVMGSPTRSGKVPLPKGRRASDMESSEADRRLSMSSASSHEGDIAWPKARGYGTLGLTPMDVSSLPDWAQESVTDLEEGGNGIASSRPPIFVWKGDGHKAQMLRIQFKKRIAALWLEAYGLKQYVDLNLTAFEKILKK